MSGLKDQFESVGAESLAATGDDHLIEPETPQVDSQEATADDQAGKGRTIDNVYGELSRKHERLEKTVTERLDRLFARLDSAPSRPETQQPKTLEDYSVDELTTHLNSLPPDSPQRPQVESAIAHRIVNDKVKTAVAEATGRERMNQSKREAIRVAKERYPDLGKEGSPFWNAVDRELRYRGEAFAQGNPNAVLDVANEVAARMGVSAQRNARTTVRVPERPANRRDGAAPVQGDEQFVMTEQEANGIATRLEAALGRKFTQDEITKIRSDHASYHGAKNLFVRG
jgi:hypothetical protein